MGQHSCRSRCHDRFMPNDNNDKSETAARASVQKEMAKPRMARSARIAELKLDTARTPEQPSTTMPETVNKIIPARDPSWAEKARIAVDGADYRHRDLRIQNTLTDEHGDDVKLMKGVQVKLTVTTKNANRSA
jgi:hypothetical protein